MTDWSQRSAAMPSVEPTSRPVPPSRLVRLVMRPMTRLLNPLLSQIAGGRHMHMAALVLHRGRVTGREYATPAGARLSRGRFVVPLTFGE
jgi:hypothetical protein